MRMTIEGTEKEISAFAISQQGRREGALHIRVSIDGQISNGDAYDLIIKKCEASHGSSHAIG